MRVDNGRLNWGVFFVALGAIPLAYHLMNLDPDSIRGLWRLWPLVLIGLGLGLVLSRTPVAFMGGLVVAACLGLVFGSMLTVPPSFGCGGSRTLSEPVQQSGNFSGISRLELSLPCGEASIGQATDSDWHVSTAKASGQDARVSASSTLLQVSAGNGDWWSDRGWNSWNISVPTASMSDLSATTDAGESDLSVDGVSFGSMDFTLNAGSLHVDLAGVSVGSLSLTTNAGSSRLTIDASSDVSSGSITTNAGSANLCVADGVGLAIKSTETLASSNLGGSGLTKYGDTWRTSNFPTAQHKINLEATTNAGSFNVRIGGC